MDSAFITCIFMLHMIEQFDTEIKKDFYTVVIYV